jgi:small conductance mechanosensitive channel
MPEIPNVDLAPLGRWLLEHGSRILLILVLSFVVYRLFVLIARRLKRRVQTLDEAQGSALDKRAETLFDVVTNAAAVAVVTAATLSILQELDVEIGPLLASVGIVGLALGLGAQTLVKDVIAGFFILVENQYVVGDLVELVGLVGTVEAVTLRVTHVRDVEGVLHMIPNGEIRTVSNRSRDWSRAIVDVGITYEDDVDKALATLREIGEALVADPEMQARLVDEPTVTGVEGLEDWQVRLRLMVKTKPTQHLDVERYLRQQIRETFPERGLTLASPRQEIVVVGTTAG